MSWSGEGLKQYQHQADAVISQANPVSTTLYTVLGTTPNVRILSIAATITWATTQPTPLEIVVTIDGNSLVYGIANPVSGFPYAPIHSVLDASTPEANQRLGYPFGGTDFAPFPLEGRSVKVEVRVTWGVTQPTPLVCRVKYAKR